MQAVPKHHMQSFSVRNLVTSNSEIVTAHARPRFDSQGLSGHPAATVAPV